MVKWCQQWFYFEAVQGKCGSLCFSVSQPQTAESVWILSPAGASSALSGVTEASGGVTYKMRLLPVVVTLLVTVGLAYYVYVPLPDGIQEPWKLMMLDAGFRAAMRLVRQEMFSLGLWCT